MPYIDTKDVAAMRKAIKAALPDYKISVTKDHHSTVDVAILSGPIVGVDNVNVYWYKDNLGPEKLDRPDAIAVVDTILAEIRRVRAPKIVSEDGDYGSIPNFYYDVSFGKWDQPYLCTDPDAQDRLEIQQEFRKLDRWHEQEARMAEYRRERESNLRLVG
jgi:hypothetical protein